MAKIKWQAAVAKFMRLRQSKKPKERVQAARAIDKALIRGVHKDAAKLLVALLTEEIARGRREKKEERVYPKVIETVVSTLKRLTEPDSVKFLLGFVKNPRAPWRVRSHIIEGLGAGENPEVVRALREAANSDDPKIRVASIDAFARIRAPEALDVFLKGLSDPAWQVQIAAVHALSKLSLREGEEKDRVVEALIRALGKAGEEGGRLKWEIVEALRNITYERIGVDPAAWERWWERRKRGEDGEPEAGGTRAVVPEYHGLKIWSTRIVFVIDTTGSMADPATKTDPKDKPRTPLPLPPQVTGAAKTKAGKTLIKELMRLKEKNDKREVKTKMDAEKKELINAILLLSPVVQFTIIPFAHTARPWKPTLVPATPQNKIGAVKMLEGLNPLGGTDIHRALVAAFQVYRAAGDRKKGKKGPGGGVQVTGGKRKRNPTENMEAPADEIFLLTDGRPSQNMGLGDMANPDRICAEVRKLNKVRKIKINTVGVGKVGEGRDPIDPAFLRRLAKENGGKFVHVQ
jgi:HEAT repeat protein